MFINSYTPFSAIRKIQKDSKKSKSIDYSQNIKANLFDPSKKTYLHLIKKVQYSAILPYISLNYVWIIRIFEVWIHKLNINRDRK